MKLDAKSVAGLTLGNKTDVIHFDDALHGFGFRLRANEAGQVRASWIVQYRRAGASRRMLLGSAEVLSAAQAREKAKETLAKVALGQDPQSDKAGRRSADKLSTRSVIDEFLATKERELRPRSFAELKRYLTGPHFKMLHSVPVDQVTRRDVAAQLVTMARTRGAATAGLARQALSGFFAWAMQQGLIADEKNNPCTGTAKPKTGKARERVLSDTELAGIWHAAADLGDYGKIIRLLTLTGQRRSEVGAMAWSEFDRGAGTWTLPAVRTKNGRAHTLPLMPAMTAIIDGVPRRVTRDCLFGLRGGGYTAWGIAKAALDAKLKFAQPWTVHDLRRTVATGMGHLRVQPHVIEAVLNHQSGHKAGVAGVYNKSSYTNEVKAALATWHDHLHTIVEGGERKILSYPA